jgi:4-hydroxyphenylacetate decarboxylase large subunit
MGKAPYLRGSYPMPWLSEAFFMAQEGELYQAALDAGKVSADQVTTMGQGGGNVTESVGNVISIAGKFGLRREEMPMLLDIAKKCITDPWMTSGLNMNRWSPDIMRKKRLCGLSSVCSTPDILCRRDVK